MNLLRGAACNRMCSAIVRLQFLAVACLGIIFMASSPPATAGELDAVRLFNIPGQPLDKALLEFGVQAHVQLSISLPSTKTKQLTATLKGRYTAKEALATLLVGTGLRFDLHGLTVEIRQSRKTAGSPQDGNASAHPLASESQPDPPSNRNGPEDNKQGKAAVWLHEVTVTAQKYRQRALDVPIDLDVIGAQALRRLNITSLNDLQYHVPGLYVSGGNVYHYIVLRGVSNEAGNGSLVGEYIDDADISAEGYAGQVGYGTGDVQLYDLKRVEVLKGPQGTLYGDGAMGGVMRFITNKPALDRYEMSTDVAALFSQYGAPSQRTQVMLNIPVVSNEIGVRIAGQLRHDGGWVDEPAANLKNINSLDLADFRMEALFRPNSHFKALATQVIHRERYGIGSGETAGGEINPVYGVTLVPNGEQAFNLSNVTLTAELAGAKLLSSSTYLKHTETINNVSYVIGPEIELEKYLPLTNSSFSEELRVQSVTQGPWQWTLGGFFRNYHDDDSVSEYFGLAGPLSNATYYHLIGDSEQSKDEAVFADTNVAFLRRFIIGAGVRYFKSRFRIQTRGALIDNLALVAPDAAQQSVTSTDPRYYLQYRVSSNVNTYVTAAKGFRSGEPNLGLFVGFNPESLWSYDFGTKARFLQGRLRLDTDVFYEKYSNYVGQGLITVDGIPEFGSFNIGEARIKGVDADAAWWLSPRWRMEAKGEVVNSRFGTITARDTGILPGERMPFVPGYMFTGSIEREFQWGGKPGFAQVSYSQTASVRGYSSPVIQSDVMHFLGARIGIHWSEDLKLAIFAQNLLNDRGYLDPAWNEAAAYRPRPRTIGVDFALALE
jgi:iron complex outermembrane receptor protein